MRRRRQEDGYNLKTQSLLSISPPRQQLPPKNVVVASYISPHRTEGQKMDVTPTVKFIARYNMNERERESVCVG